MGILSTLVLVGILTGLVGGCCERLLANRFDLRLFWRYSVWTDDDRQVGVFYGSAVCAIMYLLLMVMSLIFGGPVWYLLLLALAISGALIWRTYPVEARDEREQQHTSAEGAEARADERPGYGRGPW